MPVWTGPNIFPPCCLRIIMSGFLKNYFSTEKNVCLALHHVVGDIKLSYAADNTEASHQQ